MKRFIYRSSLDVRIDTIVFAGFSFWWCFYNKKATQLWEGLIARGPGVATACSTFDSSVVTSRCRMSAECSDSSGGGGSLPEPTTTDIIKETICEKYICLV